MAGETCKCLACAMMKFLDERYPNGQDRHAQKEILAVCADLAGVVLATKDENAFERFVFAVADHRAARQVQLLKQRQSQLEPSRLQ